MRSQAKIGFVMAAAVLGLSACNATTGTAPQPAAWDAHTLSPVADSLSQSADRTAKALEELAMIEKARTMPAPPAVDETRLDDELARPTNVEWTGPAEELVEKLAARIGYDFRVIGDATPVPVMAQVSLKEVPVAKAFESIGMQIVPFATVVLDPNRFVVEFRYDNAGN